MAEASKAVAEKKATEVAAFDFAQLQKDAGKGNENVGKDDLALPFIKILSGVDPMMDKLDGKKGDIYNSVTEALYSGKEGIRETRTSVKTILPYRLLRYYLA